MDADDGTLTTENVYKFSTLNPILGKEELVKNYFIETPEAALFVRLTETARIALVPFVLRGQEGFLFEEQYLEAYLIVVRCRLERERRTDFEGVFTLELSPTETQTEVPAVPTAPAVPAPRPRRTRQAPTVRIEFEEDFNEREASRTDIEELVTSTLGRATTLPIVIHDGDGEQRDPLNDRKFHIWLYSSAGSNTITEYPREIWGFSYDDYPTDDLRLPSDLGVVLNDPNDWPVAELIGNNLYLLFDWYDSDREAWRKELSQKVFQAAAPLIPLGKRERKTRTARNDVVALSYGDDRPTHHASIRRKVREVLSPVVNRPIMVHFDVDQHLAEQCDDGYFHIWVDTVPSETVRVSFPERVFGLDVCLPEDEVFEASNVGTPIIDPEGFVAAELVGNNNLYVLYDICCHDSGCTLPARHIGKILEATSTVLRMDAASRQAIQQQRMVHRVQWVNPRAVDGHYERHFGLAIRDTIQPHLEGGVFVHVQAGVVAEPIDDGSFHIWLYSGAGGPQTAAPLSRLWGASCPRTQGFQPSGRGTIIYDDRSWQVAELIGRNLYIHYDLTVSNYDYFNSCDRIFRRILDEVKFLLTASAEEQERRRQVRSVINTCDQRFDYASEILGLIEEIILPAVDRTVVVHIGGGERPETTPIRDDHFHLWLWATPNGGRPANRWPATLFGTAVSRESMYMPSGTGGVILDPDHQPVAEFVEQNLYVLGHCFTRSFGREGVFKKILEASVAYMAMTPEQRAELNRRYQDFVNQQSRDQYVRACAQRAEVQRNKLRHDLEVYRQKIAEVTASLVDLYRRSRENERLITLVRPSTEAEHAAYTEEFEKLLQVRGVQRVVVTEETIQVFTDIITCVDPRNNRRHEIGAFRLTINLDGQRNGLRFENLTRRIGSYDAPHVNNGAPCLGNMQEQIPELLATFQFSILIMVALEFLESVNVNDAWGAQISQWPLAQA